MNTITAAALSFVAGFNLAAWWTLYRLDPVTRAQIQRPVKWLWRTVQAFPFRSL
jgi:hypothetical protein